MDLLFPGEKKLQKLQKEVSRVKRNYKNYKKKFQGMDSFPSITE